MLADAGLRGEASAGPREPLLKSSGNHLTVAGRLVEILEKGPQV